MKRRLGFNRLRRLLIAATFAEAGEHETAMEVMDQKAEQKKRKKARRKKEKTKAQQPTLRL